MRFVSWFQLALLIRQNKTFAVLIWRLLKFARTNHSLTLRLSIVADIKIILTFAFSLASSIRMMMNKKSMSLSRSCTSSSTMCVYCVNVFIWISFSNRTPVVQNVIRVSADTNRLSKPIWLEEKDLCLPITVFKPNDMPNACTQQYQFEQLAHITMNSLSLRMAWHLVKTIILLYICRHQMHVLLYDGLWSYLERNWIANLRLNRNNWNWEKKVASDWISFHFI